MSLTEPQRRVLTDWEVARLDRLERQAGIPQSKLTYYNYRFVSSFEDYKFSRDALMAAGYMASVGNRDVITDAGRAALADVLKAVSK